MCVPVPARLSTRLLQLSLFTTLVVASAHVLSGASHGVIDSSFSGDGKATVDFGFDDRARAVVVQPDGKIVVAGSIDGRSSPIPAAFGSDFEVTRFNPDGSLDTTFSGDGKVSINFGGADFAQAVALQADGKIVVAGFTDINFLGRLCHRPAHSRRCARHDLRRRRQADHQLRDPGQSDGRCHPGRWQNHRCR